MLDAIKITIQSHQKTKETILSFGCSFDEIYLMNIYRIFHLQQQNSCPPSAHRTISGIGYMLGHKINLNIFKKMEIWHRITSDHKSMKLGINNGKNLGKFATFSHTTRLSQRTQKGNRNILWQMTMEMQTSKGAHKMLQEKWVCAQGSTRSMSVHTRCSKRDECAHRVLQEGWVCTQGASRGLVQQQKPAFKTVNYFKVTVWNFTQKK